MTTNNDSLLNEVALLAGLLVLDSLGSTSAPMIGFRWAYPMHIEAVGPDRATIAFEAIAATCLRIVDATSEPVAAQPLPDAFDDLESASMKYGFTDQAMTFEHLRAEVRTGSWYSGCATDFVRSACSGEQGLCWIMFTVASRALELLVSDTAATMEPPEQTDPVDRAPTCSIGAAIDRLLVHLEVTTRTGR
jgi:hypothetical protein